MDTHAHTHKYTHTYTHPIHTTHSDAHTHAHTDAHCPALGAPTALRAEVPGPHAARGLRGAGDYTNTHTHSLSLTHTHILYLSRSHTYTHTLPLLLSYIHTYSTSLALIRTHINTHTSAHPAHDVQVEFVLRGEPKKRNVTVAEVRNHAKYNFRNSLYNHAKYNSIVASLMALMILITPNSRIEPNDTARSAPLTNFLLPAE